MNKVVWFSASIFKAQKYAAKFLPTSECSADRCWALLVVPWQFLRVPEERGWSSSR